MQKNPLYKNVVKEVIYYFSKKIKLAYQAGINDIIIDPGFGFGKNIDDNFKILKQLDLFQSLNKPIMVGLSRKSMIYKTLKITPEESLNGTTVLNTKAIA